MENIYQLLQYFMHIDVHLIAFVSTYGSLTYIVLFMIIFCETGLVVTPFLPGDSLLFAAGSIAANSNEALNIQLLFLTLSAAAIMGNKLNYLIGRAVGPRIFAAKESWLFNKNHLHEANRFYEKHGGKTIILARFIPIIRTFAPFVAGIGRMKPSHFTVFNIISGVLWTGSLTGAGYYFGGLPLIKNNFTLVIYGIIAISLLPPLIAFISSKSTRSG